MVAGLQVFGDHGFAQIDETYRNLTYKTKGSVTLSTSMGATQPLWGSNFTVTAVEFPVVAARSTSLIGFIGFTQSGSDWTFYYMSSTNGAVVDWYHFDVPPTGGASNYLEIFDSLGRPVYNALQQPMRVVDVRTPGAGADQIYTAGRKYAGIQGAVGWSYIDSGIVGKGLGTYRSWMPGQIWSNDYTGQFRGNGYAVGLQIDNGVSFGTAASLDQHSSVRFTVVDVTGY